jgi:polyisoprenoid-binding protein YceI
MQRVLTSIVAGLFVVISGAADAAPKPASTDPQDAPAGLYVLDKTHASLIARVSHMGLSNYTMRFDGVDAQFNYDPADPGASQIEVTVDANSMDVGSPKLERDFARSFLDADDHPKITFNSTQIQRDGVHGTVTGDLTLRGVTRPVMLAVTFNGCGPGFMGLGGYRMGFSATGDVQRSDFGSKQWSSVVGDDVHLVIEAEFVRK